jgi:hypothetical protein
MMASGTRHVLGTTAVLCLALLAAACGSKTTPAAAGGPASPTAAPGDATSSAAATPVTQPSGTPSAAAAGCASSGLKVTVDTSQSGAAAGSTYVPIDFTNTSASSCTLFGYPGVSFVSGPTGSQLGKPAIRNTGATATTVTLAPGGVAHATLQVAEAGNYSASDCTPVTAHWLRIFPPNQLTAIYAHYTVQACSAKLPHQLGSQLAVYVVRPGPGKTGQGP